MFIQLSCALLLCGKKWSLVVCCRRCASVEFQQILSFTGGFWDLARPLRHSVAGNAFRQGRLRMTRFKTLQKKTAGSVASKSSNRQPIEIDLSMWIWGLHGRKDNIKTSIKTLLPFVKQLHLCPASADVWIECWYLWDPRTSVPRSQKWLYWPVGCGGVSKSLIAKMEDWKDLERLI